MLTQLVVFRVFYLFVSVVNEKLFETYLILLFMRITNHICTSIYSNSIHCAFKQLPKTIQYTKYTK